MIYFKMTDNHPSSRTMDAYVGPGEGILIRRVKDTTSDRVESFTVRIADMPSAGEPTLEWMNRSSRQIKWLRNLANEKDLEFLEATKNKGVLWFQDEAHFLKQIEDQGLKI